MERLKVYIGRNNAPALIAACGAGQLDVAKWLYTQEKYISKSNFTNALNEACEKGHLGIVQWIYKVQRVDIANHYPYIGLSVDDIKTGFSLASINGHLDIVQWFLSSVPFLSSCVRTCL